MINLIVQGKNVDLYGDETIQIKVLLKTLQDPNVLSTSYTNRFQVPATDRNTQIFSFYFNPSVSITTDYRYGVPASIEIDTVPFKKGYIRLTQAITRRKKVTSYELNFVSNDVSLFAMFGNTSLKELDWSTYNYTEIGTGSDNHSRDGMSGTGSVDNDDVIFPLVQSIFDDTNGKWTEASLAAGAAGTASYTELKPAFRIRRIFDMITDLNPDITFDGEFLNEANPDFEHFNKIYMYCPYKYDPENNIGEANRRWPFLTWTPNIGYSDDIINISANVFNVGISKTEAGRHSRITLNAPAGPGITFTIESWISSDGAAWYLGDSVPVNSVGGSNFVTFDYLQDDTILQTGGDINYAYYAITTNETDLNLSGSYEILGSDQNQNPTFPDQQGTGNMGNYNVSDPNEDFVIRVPNMTLKDFVKSLVSMFNLMVYSDDGYNYTLNTYEYWRSTGKQVDISHNVDMSEGTIITPTIPSFFNFYYNDSEAVVNKGYENLNGVKWGNLEYSTGAEGVEKIIDASTFSCPLFENIGTNLLLFSCYDTSYDTIFDEIFLMYWAGEANATIDFVGWTAGAISSYKVCNTFYPLADPTHSLNFDNNINPWDNTNPAVGLYDKFYSYYFSAFLNPQSRGYHFKALNLNIDADSFDLKDILTIGNKRFFIDQYTANLTTDEVDLKLYYLPDRAITLPLPPPVDKTPPNMGILSIDCGVQGLAIPTGITLTEI